MSQTENMEFWNPDTLAESYAGKLPNRTFKGRVNEVRLFIMLGVPRKKLVEKGFAPHLLTAAYAKYSDEEVEKAMIRRICKLIKESNKSKEEILRKGYSEADYEKAKQTMEE